MKNFKTIFFALLCVSLISCSNDDDDDNSGETIFKPIAELKNYRYNTDNALSVETPNDNDYSNSLIVYPNPTKDYL